MVTNGIPPLADLVTDLVTPRPALAQVFGEDVSVGAGALEQRPTHQAVRERGGLGTGEPGHGLDLPQLDGRLSAREG